LDLELLDEIIPVEMMQHLKTARKVAKSDGLLGWNFLRSGALMRQRFWQKRQENKGKNHCCITAGHRRTLSFY